MNFVKGIHCRFRISFSYGRRLAGKEFHVSETEMLHVFENYEMDRSVMVQTASGHDIEVSFVDVSSPGAFAG